MPAASTQGSLPSLRCVLGIICPYPFLSYPILSCPATHVISAAPRQLIAASPRRSAAPRHGSLASFDFHCSPPAATLARHPGRPSILGLRAPHLHHALRYASAQDVAAAALCCAQQPDHVVCPSGAEELAAQQAAGCCWRCSGLPHIALAVGRNRRGFGLSASGQHPKGRCWQWCARRHCHGARPECEPCLGAEDQGEQGGVC